MLTLGDHIGAYQLREVIGSGNSALVYLAEPLHQSGPRVAIKLRSRGQSPHEATLAARFTESARLHLQFCHPNIAWLHESVEAESYQALIIEYLAGGTLADYLKQIGGRMSLEAACLLGVHLCDGLEHMHDIQIIHRDIKPDNLLFADPNDLTSIRIADFDVSKNPYTSPKLTEQGSHVGTLCYTAPEQFNQEKPRPAADVYGLGMVLFEAISGRLPFSSVTAPAIFSRFLDKTPLPLLSSLVPEVSTALDWIIERSLTVEPEERIPSAATFAALLLAVCPTIRSSFKREHELMRLVRLDWLDECIPSSPNPTKQILTQGLAQLGIQLRH